jgi:hypothetical protein
LDVEGPGQLDQALWLHLVELGDRKSGNIRVMPILGKICGVDLVRADLARAVLGALAALTAIPSLRPIMLIPATTAIVSTAVSMPATELAVLALVATICGGVCQFLPVGHGCRGSRLLSHGRVLRVVGRCAAATPRSPGSRFLDLARLGVTARRVQSCFFGQLRSSSSCWWLAPVLVCCGFDDRPVSDQVVGIV